MADSENILGGHILLGNTEYKIDSIHYGTDWELIWPLGNYWYALEPVVKECAGDYTATTVPAGGGTVYIDWVFKVYVEGNNSPVDEIHNVTPSQVTCSGVGNTGFSWTSSVTFNGVNVASRGRNGLSSSSGYDSPSHANSTRSFTITAAQATIEYNGQNITASFSGEFVITQNRNRYSTSTASYSNFNVTLGATEVGANENTVSVSATCRRNTPVTFDSGASYTWYSSVDDPSEFSYSCSYIDDASDNWIGINQSARTVTAYSRAHREGDERSARIYATKGSNSGYETITQQKNEKKVRTAASDNVTAIALDSFTIPVAGGSGMTLSAKVVTGTHTDAVYYWSSLAPDTGGETHSMEGQEIELTKIQVGSNNATTTLTFSIPSRVHTEGDVSWEFYGWVGTLKSPKLTVVQPGDEKKWQIEDSDPIAYIIKTEGTFSAAASNMAFSVGAKHTHYERQYWNSDNATIGTPSTTFPEDTADKFTVEFSDINNTNRITFEQSQVDPNSCTLSHSSMLDDTTHPDSFKITVKRTDDPTKTAEYRDSASNSLLEDTGWIDDPETVVHDEDAYTVYDYLTGSYSLSASPYSGNNLAPAQKSNALTPITSALTYSASHKEATAIPYTIYHHFTRTKLYSSGYNPVSYDDPAGEDFEAVSAFSTVYDSISGNSPTVRFVVPNNSFLSVSETTVTIAENQHGARNSTVTMQVYNKDTQQWFSPQGCEITIGQKALMALSVSPASFEIGNAGQTVKITVTYKYVTFTISHAAAGNDVADPVSSMTESNGGSTNNEGTFEFYITVPENTTPNHKQGDVIITPMSGSGLSPVSVEVWQAANIIEGILIGVAEASWSGNNIEYSWYFHNTGNTKKTVHPTIYIYSTSSDNFDPDHDRTSQNEGSISLGEVEVFGNETTNTVTGTKTGITRDPSRSYWVKISGTGITSDWNPFDDNSAIE